MTTIDPARQLAAIVRNEASALRGRESARARANPGAATASQRTSGELASVVAQRVAAIDRNAPDRKQRAFRVFLETALLHELGAGLIRDAGFAEMVDAVQGRMQADPQLAAAADELGTLLVAGHGLNA